MSGETIECVAHKWHFPPDEVCPVCEGIEFEQERIIKLLEEHVWQLDVAPNGKWKQRCRCGFYGVFNEHLIELINGDNPTIDK
jgi:hypothetical protein